MTTFLVRYEGYPTPTAYAIRMEAEDEATVRSKMNNRMDVGRVLSIEPYKPVWMVAGTPYESGGETPTFGPFVDDDGRPDREAAIQFALSLPGRYVYDAVQNRRSLCGPWLP